MTEEARLPPSRRLLRRAMPVVFRVVNVPMRLILSLRISTPPLLTGRGATTTMTACRFSGWLRPARPQVLRYVIARGRPVPRALRSVARALLLQLMPNIPGAAKA